MTSAGVWAPCSEHAEAMASFSCEGCGRRLCYECVDEGKLVICRHCGEQALEIEGSAPPAEPAVMSSGPEILHREVPERARATASRGENSSTQALVASAMTHLVVPAALILMGYSFLSFLVEVRSVYFRGGGALKWLGFFFVVATVLIERYGRVSRRSSRQGMYSLALAAATLLVLVASPWDAPGSGWQAPVLNSLIILATWKLLTAVTGGVSQEGEDVALKGRRLYGLERIALERFQRQRGAPRLLPVAPASAAPRPTVLVARLAVIALVVFALAEPVLLAGVPEAGERGLTAMVLFFLATGMVLASCSFVELQRRLRRGGSHASSAGLAGRVAAAALLLVGILSLALGLPGIHYQGKNEITPAEEGESELMAVREADGEARPFGEDRGRGDAEGRNGGQAANPREAGAGRAADGGRDGRQGAESAGRPMNEPAGQLPSLEEQRKLRESWGSREDGARQSRGERAQRRSPGAWGASLLAFLGQLGKWLVVPVVLLGLAIIAFAVWRLSPYLLRMSAGPKSLFQRWLAWMARILGPRSRPRAGEDRFPREPWENLEELGAMEPRLAIVEAYGRTLSFLHREGFPRAEGQTPEEFLSALPPRLHRPPEPLRALTVVYIRAAYGAETLEPGDRQRALEALRGLRRLLA